MILLRIFWTSQHKANIEQKKSRKYKDLIEGQFSIDNVVRIERKNDPNTISNKIFDFSYGTLKHLRKAGNMDAINQFDMETTDKRPRLEDWLLL